MPIVSSNLIWVQTVSKCYQQMTKVAVSRDRVERTFDKGVNTTLIFGVQGVWFEREHIILGLINFNLIFQFELFIAYSINGCIAFLIKDNENNLNMFLLFELLLNMSLNFWSVKISIIPLPFGLDRLFFWLTHIFFQEIVSCKFKFT